MLISNQKMFLSLNRDVLSVFFQSRVERQREIFLFLYEICFISLDRSFHVCKTFF